MPTYSWMASVSVFIAHLLAMAAPSAPVKEDRLSHRAAWYRGFDAGAPRRSLAERHLCVASRWPDCGGRDERPCVQTQFPNVSTPIRRPQKRTLMPRSPSAVRVLG